MTTTIGPDGLTDEERAWTQTITGKTAVEALRAFRVCLDTLAAERLAHAETRARAESMHATLANLRDCVRNLEADRNAAVEMLTAGGVALGVHSASSMREHAAVVNLQVRDLRARAEKAEAERDRLRAALEAMRVAGDRLHDDLVLYHAAAAVIPEWNRARALLGEVKP